MRPVRIEVRGSATDSEIAAVLATLTVITGRPARQNGYPAWRRVRVSAVRNRSDGEQPSARR
ncbi:MAG: hypothetical protein M3O28_09215 [Actinomycetota bacterium]|nr:hypothetical protein [Actinomycetota bacterium]